MSLAFLPLLIGALYLAVIAFLIVSIGRIAQNTASMDAELTRIRELLERDRSAL
jgi:hypothetical protein